jgi:hypothetical protein
MTCQLKNWVAPFTACYALRLRRNIKPMQARTDNTIADGSGTKVKLMLST